MIDGNEQIASVHRQVSAPGAETRTVTLTQTYASDVDDLWDAVTNAERIPRWFLPVTGDLRLGGHYQLEGNAGGTIEECEPPTRFRATWEFGGGTSWIEVRLVAESADRTRLELAHTAPIDDHWTEFGPGAVGIGWDLGLIGLFLHLATGAPVDPVQRRRVDALGSRPRLHDAGAATAGATPMSRRASRATSRPAPPTRTLAAYTGGDPSA